MQKRTKTNADEKFVAFSRREYVCLLYSDTLEIMEAVSVWAVMIMKMMQDGVEIYCLPDNAYCSADEGKGNPLDFDGCPVGNGDCNGDCYYYMEDDEK